MKDTAPEVQAEFRRRLRATGPTRRLRMMSGMFASARVLARSSSRTGEGAAGESRSALFRRLYRGDFDAEELAAVSAHLDAVASE